MKEFKVINLIDLMSDYNKNNTILIRSEGLGEFEFKDAYDIPFFLLKRKTKEFMSFASKTVIYAE